jgi:hypothetical protein
MDTESTESTESTDGTDDTEVTEGREGTEDMGAWIEMGWNGRVFVGFDVLIQILYKNGAGSWPCDHLDRSEWRHDFQ